MVDVSEADFPKSIHNFGIFKKSGKRAILQFDFKNNKLNIIQHGIMKYSFDFEQLLQYESEEGLNLVLKIVNKDFEFDAGNTEEKHTICRLLGMILYGGDFEPMSSQESSTECSAEVPKRRSRSIIKEGILEKKGNTAIPMWAKRKVLVTPGEFSYFRPDEEVALNIIHLWTNDCKIKPYGSNGFAVNLTNRTYYFRVVGDGKSKDKNSLRHEWITAFEKACKLKRATVMLFGQEGNISRPYLNKDHEYLTQLQPIHNLSSTMMNAVQSKSFDDEYCDDDVDRNNRSTDEELEELVDSEGEPLEDYEDEKEDDSTEGDSAENQDTPHLLDKNKNHQSMRLSTVSPTTPLPSLTADRPKPPNVQRLKRLPSNTSETQMENAEINEETEYSNTSVTRFDYKESDNKHKTATEINGEIAASKSDKFHPEKRPDNSNICDTSAVLPQSHQTSDTDKNKSDKRNLAIDSVATVSTTLIPVNRTEPVQNTTNDAPVHLPPVTNNTDVSLQDNTKSDSLSSHSEKETKVLVQAPPKKFFSNVSVPLPDEKSFTDVPAPPPPVPPPPLHNKKSALKSGRVSNRKLKQVHWTNVPKISLNNSIWRKAANLTAKINTEQLELLFCVKETTVSSPAPKKDKDILIDARRAQNISILMKGLKTEGAKSLNSILNSVHEDESFPAEKITTIRRYQPTQDEIEMYKMYSSRRHELHPVDQFMLELCEIKCLSIRLDLVLILWDYPRQLGCVNETVDTLLKACSELLKSESLVAVLCYILAIGNYMNSRYHKMDKGFQLSSCERFLDIRGTKSKYTLLHFLVDQLTATDPQLLNWTSTVSTIKKCQNLSVKIFSAEIEVLKSDLHKMKKYLKTLNKELKSPTHEDTVFCKTVQKLLSEREIELEQLTTKCSNVQQKYKHVLEKFGESSFLPSDQFFSSVSRFIEQYDQAKSDCNSSIPIV